MICPPLLCNQLCSCAMQSEHSHFLNRAIPHRYLGLGGTHRMLILRRTLLGSYWNSGLVRKFSTFDLRPAGTHRTAILRRMLIGIRARLGGIFKRTFFSAVCLRSAGTHRTVISGRMLIRIQPRRPPIARNPHRMI